QYGVSTGVVAGSVTITSSSPAKNFTDAQVRSLLSGNIGGSIPYNNKFLYLVITQPGSTDPTDGSSGFLGNHSFATAPGGRFYYGWTENVGGTGAMDDITEVL